MRNKRLIELRVRAGLSQGHLAQNIGVSQSMIARIESGEREPRKAIRMKLAIFFKVSVGWLFFEEPDYLGSCNLKSATP